MCKMHAYLTKGHRRFMFIVHCLLYQNQCIQFVLISMTMHYYACMWVVRRISVWKAYFPTMIDIDAQKVRVKHFSERKPDSVFGVIFTVNSILFFNRQISFILTILILRNNTTKRISSLSAQKNPVPPKANISNKTNLSIYKKIYLFEILKNFRCSIASAFLHSLKHAFTLWSANKRNEKSLCSLFITYIFVNEFPLRNPNPKKRAIAIKLYILFYFVLFNAIFHLRCQKL